MVIRPFQLERFFDRYEFDTPHLLSASDCETVSVGELLAMAGHPVEILANLRLGYTGTQGDPALRQQIAALYAAVRGDDVLVTNAPSEGIFLVMQTLLEPGDRVVVQTPCYQSLLEVARARGCAVAPWPLRETDTGWRLDLDHLDALLSPGTRLLVVNFPQNPTGAMPEADQLQELLGLAQRRGVRVFSDEMYRGLEPGRRLPSAVDLSESAVALWGMSKTFGLPGLRIGWLVTRDRRVRQRLLELKDYTTLCASAPGELLARVALEMADTLIRRNLETVRANSGRLQALCTRPDRPFAWRAPAAGPVALVRFEDGSARRFCDAAREEARVLLVPSTLFEFGDAHIRFGLGRRSFAAGLEVLDDWLARRVGSAS